MEVGLSPTARERVLTLVDRYDLRSYWRVPIIQVARWQGWEIRYEGGIYPAHAYAVVCGPVKLMVVNEDTDEAHQRFAMAHELCHDLLGHRFGLDLRGDREVIGDAIEEREADLGAALLLMPGAGFSVVERPRVIAERCVVPEWVVNLRTEELRHRLNAEHRTRNSNHVGAD